MVLFSAKLRELREAAGLTQAELAERAGLSLGSITQLEQGRRQPSFKTALALAEALGTDCLAFTKPLTGKPVKRGRGRPRGR